MKSPKISVIIPVYNTEKYVGQCIQSILEQNFIDFELLLIDDGSTDRSSKICDEYAQKDERVKVFHKENGGVSAARNLGLDEARGEWVVFVDADDYVETDYFRRLLTKVDESIDLVITFPNVILRNESHRINHYPNGVVASDNFENLFTAYDLHEHTSPWCKLFRADVIMKNSIRFPVGVCFGEDAVFLYTFLLYVRKVCCLNYTGYCYRGDGGMLSKRINLPEQEYRNYQAIYDSVQALINGRNVRCEEALAKLKALLAVCVWRVLGSVYHSNLSRHARLQIVSSLDMSVMKHKQIIATIDKIYVFTLYHRFFRLYDLLRLIGKNIKMLKR